MPQTPSRPRPVTFILTWLKGIGMGAADVVPGFSGGTVALLTGIYEELVTAISRFDRDLVRLVGRGDWRGAAQHVNLPFLATLVAGIACGFVTSLLTINRYLKSPETSPFIFAAFIGLVLGSSRFLMKEIQKIRALGPGEIGLIALGTAAAAGICSLTENLVAAPPLWYIFLCAIVAICAMILPGISGAMMLTIFGVYRYLLGVGEEVIHRTNLVPNLIICVVFGCGCVFGLISFSRLLKWLFATRPAGTMCVLFGLMLGSVVRLWPYQKVGGRTPDVGWFPVLATIVITGVAIVLVTEYADRKSRKSDTQF